jgi:RNA polymerase sigma factor (sigma-70 family)
MAIQTRGKNKESDARQEYIRLVLSRYPELIAQYGSFEALPKPEKERYVVAVLGPRSKAPVTKISVRTEGIDFDAALESIRAQEEYLLQARPLLGQVLSQYVTFDSLPRNLKALFTETSDGKIMLQIPDDPQKALERLSEIKRELDLRSVLNTKQRAEVFASSSIEDNRTLIAGLIKKQLEQTGSALLEHQESVMEELNAFLSVHGNTSGYISLPTGTGKTAIAADLVKALRGKSKVIILSPTQPILEKTAQFIGWYAPDAKISLFYQRAKETSSGSDVILTTYQSFVKAIASGAVNSDEIGLIICDEAHNALGEERHKILRAVPNAIKIGMTATPYFMPLDGYQSSGMVDPHEPWTKMFTLCISRMGIEEAINRGLLPPVESILIGTEIAVRKLKIGTSNSGTIPVSDYAAKELSRALDVHHRNMLAVGIIAGIDSISDIALSPERIGELRAIHEKVKGRGTVVFGISVDNIKKIEEMLVSRGVSAAAVYGDMDPAKRDEILKDHAEGRLQVILSVDLLMEGWDSPRTSVGIMLRPTLSAIVAIQRLGRLLRLSEGKDVATVIELVDRFELLQNPTTVPNIFDPSYVLEGTATGAEPVSTSKGEKAKRPVISVEGMDVNVLISNAMYRKNLASRFEGASLSQITETIDALLSDFLTSNPRADFYKMCKSLSDTLPQKLRSETIETVLAAIADIDSNISKNGKMAFIYLNMKTILGVAEKFFGKNERDNEEILMAAIEGAFGLFLPLPQGGRGSRSLSANTTVPALHAFCTRSIKELLSIKDGTLAHPTRGIRQSGISDAIDYYLERMLDTSGSRIARPGGLLPRRINVPFSDTGPNIASRVEQGLGRMPTLSELAAETGADEDTLAKLLKLRIGSLEDSFSRAQPMVSGIVDTIDLELLRKEIELAMAPLTERKRDILRMRFGLDGGEPLSLDEIAEKFGLTRERIRQNEISAFKTMRKTYRRREGLRSFLDSEFVAYSARKKTPEARKESAPLQGKPKEHLHPMVSERDPHPGIFGQQRKQTTHGLSNSHIFRADTPASLMWPKIRGEVLPSETVDMLLDPYSLGKNPLTRLLTVMHQQLTPYQLAFAFKDQDERVREAAVEDLRKYLARSKNDPQGLSELIQSGKLPPAAITLIFEATYVPSTNILTSHDNMTVVELIWDQVLPEDKIDVFLKDSLYSERVLRFQPLNQRQFKIAVQRLNYQSTSFLYNPNLAFTEGDITYLISSFPGSYLVPLARKIPLKEYQIDALISKATMAILSALAVNQPLTPEQQEDMLKKSGSSYDILRILENRRQEGTISVYTGNEDREKIVETDSLYYFAGFESQDNQSQGQDNSHETPNTGSGAEHMGRHSREYLSRHPKPQSTPDIPETVKANIGTETGTLPSLYGLSEEQLAELLKTGDPITKATAVLLLDMPGNLVALAREDPSEIVRAAVTRKYGEKEPEKVDVEDQLPASEPQVTDKPPVSAEKLAEALDSNDITVLLQTFRYGRLTPDQINQVFASRNGVAKELTASSQILTADQLSMALSDGNIAVRTNAIIHQTIDDGDAYRILTELGSRERATLLASQQLSRELVALGLEDPSPAARRAAIKYQEGITPKDLRSARRDPSPIVREAARMRMDALKSAARG